MKASVIIPAYNRGYIIAEAIQSVLDQTYRNVAEIIVADDGSTDDTIQNVNRFRDPRIRVVRHLRNKGVAAARNTGLAAAKGDVISFLDSDDVWSEEKLEREVAFLATHPEADAVFVDLKYQGKRSAKSVVRIYPKFVEFLDTVRASDGILVPQRTMYLCMLQEMPVKIQATTFRSSALGDEWRFNEAWQSGEDWEFLLRFARTRSFGFIDQPLVLQRYMADSTFERHRKVDALFLTELFVREKRALRGDDEAIKAVQKVIANCSDNLGHFYRQDHQIKEAAKAYLRGFWETGQLRLFAQTVAVGIPLEARRKIKDFLQRKQPELANP